MALGIAFRIYDPTTGAFLSRDPLVGLTRSAYGYTGGNPVNRADPTGLCWGPEVVCKVARDTYHVVRATATVAPTVVGAVYAVSIGGTCSVNGSELMLLCTGANTDKTFTIGSTVVSGESRKYFDENPRLLAHEAKHADQWALFGGVSFPVAYGLNYWESQRFFGNQCGNIFEYGAGFADGGYNRPARSFG